MGLGAHVVAAPYISKDKQIYDKLQLLGDVIDRVQSGYVEEYEPEFLFEATINGALQSLDPHSRYVNLENFTSQQKARRREYGGLGIEVSMPDDAVLVGYVNRRGPAARAGLKSGDLITHVDGDAVKGKTLNEAVAKMRGLVGEPLKITVKSTSGVSREVTIVRETVQGRAVRHRLYKGMGYIYIETFNNADVSVDTVEAIGILEKEAGGSLDGLIIDLRNNGGGSLDRSVEIAGLFLDGGEVVSVRGRDPKDVTRYHADFGEKIAGQPLAVLINRSSASASEIVAGALQDRGRAMIIGTPSFGKGSVQSVYDLRNIGAGSLRLTTARYFTPSGSSIQGLGITPDIWLEMRTKDAPAPIGFRESSLKNSLDSIILKNEGASRRERDIKPEYLPDDWPQGEDFQLDRAVEILKAPDYEARLDRIFKRLK